LRDALLVFSLVFIIISIAGIWQYRSLRNNLLEESTSHALNEAVKKYEQLINQQEKVVQFLSLVSADSNLGENFSHRPTVETDQPLWHILVRDYGKSPLNNQSESI